MLRSYHRSGNLRAVHPDLNGEIEMAKRAGGKLDIDEPAPDVRAFRKASMNRDDIAS